MTTLEKEIAYINDLLEGCEVKLTRPWWRTLHTKIWWRGRRSGLISGRNSLIALRDKS